MAGRLILACGGYRSGSTLQYNLAGAYVERLSAGRRIGLLDPPEAARLLDLWSIVDAMGLAVAKSHHAVGGFQDFGGAEATWAILHDQGRLRPIYSVRDPRDVVASMARKFHRTLPELFESSQWRENLAHMERWLELGALVQRYERLTGDPQGALAEFAAFAGLPLDPGAVDRAVADAGLGEQRAAARALPAGEVDPRSLVHSDHIAAPEGGSWRAWSDEEAELVRGHVEGLMGRFGYAWTP